MDSATSTFTPPDKLYDCEYICANMLGWCIKYAVPDCPNCYAIYCFVAESWDYEYYICTNDTPCPLHIPPLMITIACDEYRTVSVSATPSGNKSFCCCAGFAPEICASCPAESVDATQDLIDSDVDKWLLGHSVSRSIKYYCDCELGCSVVN